jgi:hypothetical protein
VLNSAHFREVHRYLPLDLLVAVVVVAKFFDLQYAKAQPMYN